MQQSTTGGSSRPARELRRVLMDVTVSLALFWAVALAVGCDDTRAHAVTLPQIGTAALHPHAGASGPTIVRTGDSRAAAFASHRQEASQGRGQALALLSAAFAAIVASNLAFLRHLRRVYASPRRSVWRRG